MKKNEKCEEKGRNEKEEKLVTEKETVEKKLVVYKNMSRSFWERWLVQRKEALKVSQIITSI